MKKMLSSFCIIAIILTFTFVPVSAMESSEKISVILETGDTLIFNNEYDYNLYLTKQNPELRNVTATITVSTEYQKHKLIGPTNLTPSWVKTDLYTISRGRNYSSSGSVSYKNLSGNISTSYSSSVQFSMKANELRYSKIGLYADLTVQHKRDYITDMNTGRVTEVNYLQVRATETYLAIIYK